MVELKLQIEDKILSSFSYKEVENYLYESIQKLYLKKAANEILEDLSTNDFQNDADWKLSRNLAWEQEKSKYLGK